MAKYILVYEIKGYPDCGGGTFADEFGMNEQALHAKVQKLTEQHKDNFSVIYAGFLSIEYEYKAIEYAIRVQPKRI